MLQTSFQNPAAPVSTLVRRFLFIRFYNSRVPYYDKFISDGSASLVFNFHENASINSQGNKSKLPKFFLVSPLLKPPEIEISAPMDSMIVICNASVLSRLFAIKMNKDQLIPYHTLDQEIFYSLWEKLKLKTDENERITVFRTFIEDKFTISGYEPDEVDRIYNKITEIGGAGTIKEILKETGLNHRTFRRQFHQRVGINAKGLSRIVRMNYLWDQINNPRNIDFQNLVFKGGYFDQSHLINDFNKLVGESPETFFKRDLEQVKIISGKIQ